MPKPALNPSSTDRFSCLLVDDDVGFAGMLARVVSEAGGEPCARHSLAAAREEIARNAFDLVILDNRLPDGTGYEFYSHLIRQRPDSVVAMITGMPELSQAIELTRNGLFDYITKPVSAADFASLLQRAKLRLRRPEVESSAPELLGDSPQIREVISQLQQASRYVHPTVLLLGETGTGKDLAARALHRLTFGERANKAPYIALNCPNVPPDMFEAELFGSEKGSYTGADRRRAGLVAAAEGGTLFLDEVAEIPHTLQPKLLRFLESREYRSLGSTGTATFTGRIVAATNRSLAEEVRAGRLREDLMYRLDVFSIRLPPLREHIADVDSIAANLLKQLCSKYDRTTPRLNSQDLEALRAHSFPGNVRELRNLLERSLLRTDPDATYLTIDLGWLKGRIPEAVTPPLTPPDEPIATTQLPADRHLTPIEQQEYLLIAAALREENGGIRRAAVRLGLTHQALLRRLQKWPELRQAASSG